MATKAQWQRQLMRKAWVNTISSTADRDTDYNDIQVNLYAWKLPNSVLASRWIKGREDVIA